MCSVNNLKQEGDRPLQVSDFLHGRWLLLRKGKNTYHLVERTPDRESQNFRSAWLTPAVDLDKVTLRFERPC